MGVIQDTARRIKVGGMVLILAVGGLYAYTKWDTSKDRWATVKVDIGEHANRTIHANVFIAINGAEHSTSVATDKQGVQESFWIRPGETIMVNSNVSFGKASLTCVILMDGHAQAGPVTVGPDFGASCHLQAVG